MRAAYCRHGNTFARLFGVMMCRFVDKRGYASRLIGRRAIKYRASVNSSFAISLPGSCGYNLRRRETDNRSRQRRDDALPSSVNHLYWRRRHVTSNPWAKQIRALRCSGRRRVLPMFPDADHASAEAFANSKKRLMDDIQRTHLLRPSMTPRKMLRSDEPCAIALILMLCRQVAPTTLTETTGVPFSYIQTATIA